MNDISIVISGAAGASYTTTDADNDMYLKVEVTPWDDRVKAGAPVLSEASRQIGS